MPPRVVLVGLPGAGKSSVGAALAGRLAVPFADSDDLIIQRTGRSVAEHFQTGGEAAFRAVEAEVVAQALAGFDGVLALGGGAVATESVRAGLLGSGVPVVLLTAEQDELLLRIAGTGHRPLLVGDAPARLAELAGERAPLYRAVASLTVQTSGRSIAEVADELSDQIRGVRS
jgi:shikimate kinase